MTKINLVYEPTVILISEKKLLQSGLDEMTEHLKKTRPDCNLNTSKELFKHDRKREDGSELSDSELLVEIAGRNCYKSFGDKIGKASNKSYIENTQAGQHPHASIMYHVHFTFYLAGISRRLTHELIRHYVGHGRDEEGSPSQESTRYTRHTGNYIIHPNIINNRREVILFQEAMELNYIHYNDFINRREQDYFLKHGVEAKGLDRKRIYESASNYLSHSAETSLIWSCNIVSFKKMYYERIDHSADSEFQRLVEIWKGKIDKLYPNLF